jgi:ribosomal protein S18 acetylase RimI-like enzyme
MLEFRLATEADKDAVWLIIEPIIRKGDTWVFSPDSTKEKMLNYFFSSEKHTYAALERDEIVGVFFIKDNQPDLGSHICNAGYMVAQNHTGRGIGKKMCQFSIQKAKEIGYDGMQFNIVIKSNHNAVHLWLNLGFSIIGEIPNAFVHPQNGLTNAYIMYQKL